MHSENPIKTQRHSIRRTAIFLSAILLAVCAFLSRPLNFVTHLNDWPRWSTWSVESRQVSPDEVQAILAEYASSDSIEQPPADIIQEDSVQPVFAEEVTKELVLPSIAYSRLGVDDYLHENLKLYGSDAAFTSLAGFFAQLNQPQRSPPIHVFHFGDSQIEGDRITGPLRNQWQSIWGGSGPGLISPLQPIPSLSMRHSWSSGWVRHARYGRKDTTILHNRFGIMAAFATHPSLNSNDSILPCLTFEPHLKSYLRNRSFNQVSVLFGQVDSGAQLHYQLNALAERTMPLEADSFAQRIDIPLPSLDSSEFQSLRLCFSGPVPEVDGVGMWRDSGIVVHNIAMRGSSGTLFRSLDRTQLTEQFKGFRTGLILLQYGGNAVPYLTDSPATQRFGGWFASQIQLFHQLLPGVPVIVMGPSDMAHKVETRMETYAQLPSIRDALKQAALENDALYWDVFEVMGGAGSMVAWVQSSPPLASSDHIHFTPKGAREISELFRQSIQTEWAMWQIDQFEQAEENAK